MYAAIILFMKCVYTVMHALFHQERVVEFFLANILRCLQLMFEDKEVSLIKATKLV